MVLSDHLYLMILFIGAILLAILYVNSIFLYKQKLTDDAQKALSYRFYGKRQIQFHKRRIG